MQGKQGMQHAALHCWRTWRWGMGDGVANRQISNRRRFLNKGFPFPTWIYLKEKLGPTNPPCSDILKHSSPNLYSKRCKCFLFAAAVDRYSGSQAVQIRPYPFRGAECEALSCHRCLVGTTIDGAGRAWGNGETDKFGLGARDQ